jgi:hypothetical protein
VVTLGLAQAVEAGNLQGQLQGQQQKQGQAQLQGQAQVGINAQAQGQVVKDAGTQVDARENRNAYRGSFSASIPEGNEGPALLTPWGGVGISNMSRVTELLMFAEVVEDGSEEHKWLIAELQSEIGGTCRWLGFGPKGWKFPFLLGLDCWPDLRFDPKFGR